MKLLMIYINIWYNTYHQQLYSNFSSSSTGKSQWFIMKCYLTFYIRFFEDLYDIYQYLIQNNTAKKFARNVYPIQLVNCYGLEWIFSWNSMLYIKNQLMIYIYNVDIIIFPSMIVYIFLLKNPVILVYKEVIVEIKCLLISATILFTYIYTIQGNIHDNHVSTFFPIK